MRGDAKWWEKMTFEYARPLLTTSMKEEICFEQYGNCPEDLKVLNNTQEFLTSYTIKNYKECVGCRTWINSFPNVQTAGFQNMYRF